MWNGILHCHSTYSDGEFSLSELREVLLAEGCSFVCMADHAPYFDDRRVRSYVAECEGLSDSRFLFVPGIEYECERGMHVVGYGVTAPVATDDPQEVFAHIREAGGVSVIAHPRDDMFGWIDGFEVLPTGIETWSSKYDGRYAPRARTFRLLHQLQQREPRLRAFCGVDLHWRNQFRRLRTEVRCDTLDRDRVLEALAAGRFIGIKDGLRLPSSGDLSEATLQKFDRINQRSARLRKIITRTKSLVDRSGAHVPAPLKAQLRRIF